MTVRARTRRGRALAWTVVEGIRAAGAKAQ